MLGYPKSFDKLIDQLKKLPGIGHKTAQRLAFHILKIDDKAARTLAETILEVRAKLVQCPICYNLTEVTPCSICADPGRNRELICVIAEPKDYITIERTAEYRGLYHVLGGTISPLEGRTPDDLKIKELVQRVQGLVHGEIILATNPTVEGEATALYIARVLKSLPVKITRIARGIPVGGDLEFADEMTMVRALEGRREIS